MVDPLSRDSAGLPEMLDHQPSTHFAELPASPTEDPEWILVEEGFTLAREHELESLFAIGNGYAGSRASLTEGSPLSAPARLSWRLTFNYGGETRPVRHRGQLRHGAGL